MSQSEDELLGIMHDAQEILRQNTEKAQLAEQVKKSETVVKNYKALIDYPPFDFFLDDIRADIEAAEAQMDKASDAISLAKASQTYLTLRGILSHCKTQLTQHSSFLASTLTRTPTT